MGQTTLENNEKCKSADPDTRITGCTALLQEGLLTKLLPSEALSIIYYNRGYAYGRKRDYDRAIQDFDQAIHLNPDYAFAFRDRGGAYTEKGNYDRAIQDSNEAIRLDPNAPNAYYSRGNTYLKKKGLRSRNPRFQSGDSSEPELCFRL